MGVWKSIRSFLHMLSLPKPDYEVYCRDKRLERYEQYGGCVRYLGLHAMAHRILIPLMSLDMRLTGRKITVLQDDRRPTEKPVIFCPTHIGGVDIEMSFLAVHTPCWIALGNPREVYRSLDGMLMQMNGWIPLDVHEKQDRAAAKAQMKALLKKGGDLLLFPEGTQNISPNALVGHLYAGAVELAITCGAEIVPIAICRDGDEYFFAVGENISYNHYTYEERFRLTDELRDHMATLKWRMMEHLPVLQRSGIPESAYDDFVKKAITMNTEYTLTVDDIGAEAFHPKGITESREVYAFMEKLIPDQEKAFLFSKRLSGS